MNPKKMSYKPRSSRLPQELSDMIIDYLHNDRPTLTSCALVNKAWLRYARRYIFRRILGQCNTPKADLILRYGHLLDIIRLGRGVTKFVQEVHLTAHLTSPLCIRTPLNGLSLAIVLKAFPHLSSLTLQWITLRTTEYLPRPDLLSLSTSLRRLILLNCESWANQLEHIFQLAPCIDDLQLLQHCYIPHARPTVALISSVNYGNSLRSLTLGVACPDLPPLDKQNPFSSLEELKVAFHNIGTGPAVVMANRILASSESSIRILHLMIDDALSTDPLDISIPFGLQSWSFRIFASSQSVRGKIRLWKTIASRQFETVLRLLKRLPPTSVKHIEIQIIYCDDDLEELLIGIPIPWHELDRSFRDLEKVERVSFSGSALHMDGRLQDALEAMSRVPLSDQWKASLRRKLPLTSAKIEIM